MIECGLAIADITYRGLGMSEGKRYAVTESFAMQTKGTFPKSNRNYLFTWYHCRCGMWRLERPHFPRDRFATHILLRMVRKGEDGKEEKLVVSRGTDTAEDVT